MPTMTITAANSSGTAVAHQATTNDATLTVTFTSSEATNDFAVGDISVTGGTISNFSATSSTVYTATLTPSANSTSNQSVFLYVYRNQFADAAGNNNNENAHFSWFYDNIGPTMTITAEGTTAAMP